MATAEGSTSLQTLDEPSAPPLAISGATIGVVASALLIYASGSFMATALLGLKRELEVLLLIPVGVAAAYYLVSRPGRLLDPLICFAVVKLATEVALRGQVLYVLDGIAAVLALAVLVCAPTRSLDMGARFVVAIAGIFALIALAQWVWLTFDPHLSQYILVFADEEGGTETPVQHPIALLGIIGEQQYSFLGQPVGRMQSFAKEPSLNVIYFMFPAALAFLMNSRTTVLWGSTILAFCVLSLSGSVFLALAFSAVWWLLLRVTSIRFAIPYGMLILMGAFLFAVARFGSDPLLDAFFHMAQYGDFLSKTVSLTSRTASAVTNASTALASPLGSATLADLPGPMLVTAALAAGWLGVLALLWFFSRLGRQLDAFDARTPPRSARRLGTLLLVGSVATVLVFNDYQMGSYAGLIQLAFIYRTLHLRNQRGETIKGLS
jgi:hypothetical protein